MLRDRTFTAITMEPEHQALADAAIDALAGRERLTEHPALAALAEYLDEDAAGGVLSACVTNEDNWLYLPTVGFVAERAFGWFDGPDTHPEILATMRKSMKRAIDGDWEFWGEEYPHPVVGTLTHSDGRTALITFRIEMICGPYDWCGLFRDAEALERELVGSDTIQSMEQYEAIPDADVLTTWGKHY